MIQNEFLMTRKNVDRLSDFINNTSDKIQEMILMHYNDEQIISDDAAKEFVEEYNKLTNNDIIYWAKVKKNAIIPTKRDEDGWYDLYANFEENEIVFQPHEIKLIPTGIASAIHEKYKIAFGERGSNTKSKLMLMAGKLDSGWRGEWFVALYNTQHIPIEISKSIKDYEYKNDIIRVPYCKAICQCEIVESLKLIEKEISYEQLIEMKSERMFGCLGTSNK